MWVKVKVGLKAVRSPVAKVERALDRKQSSVGRMERMWSPERTLNGWYEHNELSYGSCIVIAPVLSSDW